MKNEKMNKFIRQHGSIHLKKCCDNFKKFHYTAEQLVRETLFHSRMKQNNDQNKDQQQPSLWIRGNIVHCIHHPFLKEQQQEEESTATNESLGEGLVLLRDYILTVSHSGCIESLEPYSSNTATTKKKEDYDKAIELDLRTDFLTPGFMDLHLHAPQYVFTGTGTDRPLMEWLNHYTFPAERRLHQDLTHAHEVMSSVVQRTLSCGTTTVLYWGTLHLEPCQVLVDQVLQQGQRALVGKVCMDRNGPPDYLQTVQDNVQGTKQLIDYIRNKAGKYQYQGSTPDTDNPLVPTVLPIVMPRFIPTCTPPLLQQLSDLAAAENCHITSHISETTDEMEWSRMLDQQDHGTTRTDAQIYASHGLLTDQCVMAHAVGLTENDATMLREHGTAIAHCSLSNTFLSPCCLPCRDLLKKGNLIGLGTDVAGGYHPSLLHASQMTVVAAKTVQQERDTGKDPVKESALLDYRHAFYLATLGGAKALKLDHRLGNFQLGKEFDAVVLSAGVGNNIFVSQQYDTLEDVFQKCCNLADDRNVSRVFVQGRCVVQKYDKHE